MENDAQSVRRARIGPDVVALLEEPAPVQFERDGQATPKSADQAGRCRLRRRLERPALAS